MRRLLLKAARSKPHSDPDTDYRLKWHWTTDPVVQEPVRALCAWMQTMSKSKQLRILAHRCWQGARLQAIREAPATKRWKLVRGPVSAAIATCLDMQWDLAGPTAVIDHMGGQKDWELFDKAAFTYKAEMHTEELV